MVTTVTEEYTELTELAGSFIHEIKNHLGTLGLNLQILAEDFEEAESQREKRALTRVQRLQSECQRLLDLSNDFLRYARIEDPDLTEVELTDVIEEMLDFFAPTARHAGIEVHSYIPTGLPPVRLDVELFKQAVLNLLLNAQEAMPDGGEITIQAQVEDDHILLGIIDTGVGMKPEVVAKIFKPFFSGRRGGTGLGLPTTKRIVEAHGGTIEVESAVGRGTRFALRLPAER